jgi:hypothetical protein
MSHEIMAAVESKLLLASNLRDTEWLIIVSVARDDCTVVTCAQRRHKRWLVPACRRQRCAALIQELTFKLCQGP